MMMNNTQLQQNNGLAVPLQLQPVPCGQELVQVVPMQALSCPIFVQPAPIQIITTIPRETDLFTISQNGMLQRVPDLTTQCIASGESFAAPEGFSFVSTADYFSHGMNLMAMPTMAPVTVPEVKQTNVLSQKNMNTQAEKKVTLPAEQPTQKKQGVKHPHRSKQKKIMSVHQMVEEVWLNKGKLAGDDEVLRGEDVLRIHVKTWEGLDLIQDVLEQVEQRVPISRIALPFSMKNKFQKKGFIVYLKLEDAIHVPVVQEIFSLYKEHFKKCDVALPTTKLPVLKQIQPPKVDDLALDMFVGLPPMMKRRESAGAAA